jgi:hypothetical protein
MLNLQRFFTYQAHNQIVQQQRLRASVPVSNVDLSTVPNRAQQSGLTGVPCAM